MPTLTALTVPAAFLRIRSGIGDPPFSPIEVERFTGKTGVANYVVLSRLARSGWLLRIGRGRYAAAEPAIRTDPQLEDRLAPFRARCFYPILQRAVAGILRVYSGEVIALALFGSAARGSERPESDLDLLVVVDRRSASVVEDARTQARIARFSTDIRMEEWDANRHFHQVQVVLVDRSDLRLGPDVPRRSQGGADPLGPFGPPRPRDAPVRDAFARGRRPPCAVARSRRLLGARPGLRRGWGVKGSPRFALGMLRRSLDALEAAESALERRRYALVVALAQQACELALKADLRFAGIDPPRQHDVGEFFRARVGRFPAWFRREMPFSASRPNCWPAPRAGHVRQPFGGAGSGGYVRRSRDRDRRAGSGASGAARSPLG